MHLDSAFQKNPKTKTYFSTVFLNIFWELLGEKSEASELDKMLRGRLKTLVLGKNGHNDPDLIGPLSSKI